MKILVLGSGAREHAIVASLAAEGTHDIIAAPGNPGIADESAVLALDANNPELVAEFAGDDGVDLVVIGPEAPLVAGVADALRDAGVPVFGPNRAAAQLEGSKTFAKQIMERAHVPTGGARLCTELAHVEESLERFGAPYVVKADGLAAGKGVMVTTDRDEAVAHATHWLASGPVLVEEFLDGQEVSLFVLTDGTTCRALPPAQDFKRLANGDDGPNTGGMGAYTPVPFIVDRFGSEADFARIVVDEIARPVVDDLRRNGEPFVGLLYCGLIVTEAGIRVIEFNARFGDPETQVVLTRLDQPLSELLLASATGTLGTQPERLAIGDRAAVTVVLASEGYPDSPKTGRIITGIADAEGVGSAAESGSRDGHEGAGAADGAAAAPSTARPVRVLHAATAGDLDGELRATGGRVLNVVARGADLAEARERAYAAIGRIALEGAHYRT
ncbi:MAG: phosphoribosylamine--glycine ligase, partial [Pseudoclavibacter sp.]